jgi:hypothetical protein
MTDLFIYELYNLLNNKSYYSLSVIYVSKLLNVDIKILTSSELSQLFLTAFQDKINTFIYNQVIYIGLESRRITYEEDKILGINWVENAITQGLYNEK